MNNPISASARALPWWLWVMMVVVTIAIAVGVITSATPEDPNEIFETGQSLVSSQPTDEFKECLAKLKGIEGYDKHAVYLEGRLAESQMRAPRALELYAEAATNEKLEGIANQQMGNCNFLIGDYSAAIACYEKTLEVAPELEVSTRSRLSRLYYALGCWGFASDQLKKIIEVDEGNRSARGTLSKIYLDMDDPKAALETLIPVMSEVTDFSVASPDDINTYAESCLLTDDRERMTQLVDTALDSIQDLTIKAKIGVALGKRDEVKRDISVTAKGQNSTHDLRMEFCKMQIEDERFAEVEGLVYEAIKLAARRVNTWEVAKEYFKAIEQSENADIAQQNIDKLTELDERWQELMTQISRDAENVSARAELADIYLEQQKYTEASRWALLVENMDPEVGLPIRTRIERTSPNFGPLVPIKDLDKAASEEPNGQTEDTPKEETSADSEPQSGNDGSQEAETGDKEASPPEQQEVEGDN